MKKAHKVIVTCAITGSIHTPTMSPHLPITPTDIAVEAVAAAEAGASILHLHARDPHTGAPTASADVFMKFLPQIHQRCDAVINITTGGGLGMTLDQRLEAAHRVRPELCSLNMGSLNFGIFQAAEKFTKFQHDWERPYLESTRDFILSNTFAQIERVLREVGEAYGTRFEFECYDIGHLYNLAYFVDRGVVRPPFLIQGVFGILGGIGANIEHVMHMKLTADRLFGDDYYFSALGAGRHQFNTITAAALMGGAVRVGLEDSIFLGKGELAKGNADQVRKIRALLEGLSLEIATPTETRAMLGLKGASEVSFH
jgi:uncharacterized protein (DUF849 family)